MSACLPLGLPTELLTHLAERFLTPGEIFAGLATTSTQAHQRIVGTRPWHTGPPTPREDAGAASSSSSSAVSSVDLLHRLVLRRVLTAAVESAWLRPVRLHTDVDDESRAPSAEEEERRLLNRLLHLRADSDAPPGGAVGLSGPGCEFDSDDQADRLVAQAGFPSLYDLSQWYPEAAAHHGEDETVATDADRGIASASSSAPMPIRQASYYHLLRQLLPLARLFGHWRAVRPSAHAVDDLAVSDAPESPIHSTTLDPWPLGRFVSIEWNRAARQLVGSDRSVPQAPVGYGPAAAGSFCFFQVSLRPFVDQEAAIRCVAATEIPVHEVEPRSWHPAQVFPLRMRGCHAGDGWRLFIPGVSRPELAVNLVYGLPTLALRAMRPGFPTGPHLEFARVPIAHPDWVAEGVIHRLVQREPSLVAAWRRACTRPSSVFFRPPSPLPLPGLYTAHFGGHGTELFAVDYRIVDESVASVLQSVAAEIEVDQATQPLNWLVPMAPSTATDASATASSSTAPLPARREYLILRSTKVLGDANVPAGKSSFRLIVGEWPEVRAQCRSAADALVAPVVTHSNTLAGASNFTRAIAPLDAEPSMEEAALAPATSSSAAPPSSSQGQADHPMASGPSTAGPPATTLAAAVHVEDEASEDEAAPAMGEGDMADDDFSAEEEESDADDDDDGGEQLVGGAASSPPRVRLRGKGLVAHTGHHHPRLIPVRADFLLPATEEERAPDQPQPRAAFRLDFLSTGLPFHSYRCDCSWDGEVRGRFHAQPADAPSTSPDQPAADQN